MLMALQSGQPINMKDFGVGDLNELVEDLQENMKAMEDMEKPWEQKLKEE